MVLYNRKGGRTDNGTLRSGLGGYGSRPDWYAEDSCSLHIGVINFRKAEGRLLASSCLIAHCPWCYKCLVHASSLISLIVKMEKNDGIKYLRKLSWKGNLLAEVHSAKY